MEIEVVIISVYLGNKILILSDLSRHFWDDMSGFVRPINKQFICYAKKHRTMKSLLIIPILFFLTSSEDTKILDAKAFTMEVPNAWNYIPRQGIDSFIGEIAIDNKDTLSFDYGLYSSYLEEDCDCYVSNDDSIFVRDYERDKIDTTKSAHYKFYSVGGKEKLKEFEKNNAPYYDEIAGLKVKIVTPKKSGTGTTGVVFEQINQKNGIRFQISGYNLHPRNQEAFLKAMKTIRFKNR